MKTVWFKSRYSEGYYGMLISEPGDYGLDTKKLCDPVYNMRVALAFWRDRERRHPWQTWRPRS